jgi:hypothetical protein
MACAKGLGHSVRLVSASWCHRRQPNKKHERPLIDPNGQQSRRRFEDLRCDFNDPNLLAQLRVATGAGFGTSWGRADWRARH